MLNSEDCFIFGLVFVISPFLVFFIESLFNMGLSVEAHISSVLGTIGVLFLIAAILR